MAIHYYSADAVVFGGPPFEGPNVGGLVGDPNEEAVALSILVTYGSDGTPRYCVTDVFGNVFIESDNPLDLVPWLTTWAIYSQRHDEENQS